jgi:hypothetical protein
MSDAIDFQNPEVKIVLMFDAFAWNAVHSFFANYGSASGQCETLLSVSLLGRTWAKERSKFASHT